MSYVPRLSRESTALGYKLKCRGGLMAEEAVALLKDFYATGNPKGPSSFTLSSTKITHVWKQSWGTFWTSCGDVDV